MYLERTRRDASEKVPNIGQTPFSYRFNKLTQSIRYLQTFGWIVLLINVIFSHVLCYQLRNVFQKGTLPLFGLLALNQAYLALCHYWLKGPF
jgi:hypothetical protein